MGIMPEKIVTLPEREDADHSLLASAIVPQGDARPDGWQGGLTAKAEFCGEASAWDPCSTGGDRAKSDPADNPEVFDYRPWILEVAVECSSTGWAAADYEGRAERAIRAATSKALEREFWTGEKVPSNMSLQGGTPNDDDHILNPGGWLAPQPVAPDQALLLLTAALANCGSGSRGMIHATPDLGEVWWNAFSLREVDGVLRTGARGDTVVIGSGYTGQGPYGQPDPDSGLVWAFATGPVSVYLDDPEVLPGSLVEALDRGTNTVRFRGERTAAAFHDGCCSFAVLVDLAATSGAITECVPTVSPARSYTIQAGMFEAMTPPFDDVPFDSLAIGVITGSITPAPVSVTGNLTYAPPRGPVVGTPTYSDLPSTWTDGFGGIPFPFIAVPIGPPTPDPIRNGDPVWLRFQVFDENGCYTVAYAYFPSGVPDDAVDTGLTFFIGVGDLQFVEVTLPPGFVTEPTDVLEVVDQQGICPVPDKAMAVVPACDIPFPVEGNTTGVEPVEVGDGLALPVALVSPSPVPVEVQPVPAVQLDGQQVQVVALNGGLAETSPIPAGAVMILASASGNNGTDSVRLSTEGGTEIPLPWQTGTSYYGPVSYVAPPGFTFGAWTAIAQSLGGGNDVYLTVTAYYPPGP